MDTQDEVFWVRNPMLQQDTNIKVVSMLN